MDLETGMTEEEILQEFHASGALRHGHFLLSSGRHSDTYVQCALVMKDAQRGGRVCAELAEKVRARIDQPIDLVVSPAMGGVVVGYEMGRQLGVPAIFFERVDGQFTLRRCFEIPQGARCLMVEDVVTTGLSSRECIEAATRAGGNVVAACCLVDRSGGTADVGVPLVSLLELEVPSFAPDELPPHLRETPPQKLGSRGLA